MRDPLEVLASRHHGVIFPSDLRTLGLDQDAYRATLNRLTRVSRGVYTWDMPVDPRQVHGLRAVAALRRHPGYIAGHISAAVLHRLPMFRPDFASVHLYATQGGRAGRRGSTHVQRSFWKDNVTEVNGLPVTSVPATIVDCARSQSRETAVVMADYALHQGLCTGAELEGALDEVRHRQGAAKARSVVDLADGRSESVGETRARLICGDAGIAVTPQVEVCDETGSVITRLDLRVDGHRLGLAFDGRGKYADFLKEEEPRDQKYWEEKLQGEMVEDHGFVRVHAHWEMLDQPELVVGRVRRGMQRARKLAA